MQDQTLASNVTYVLYTGDLSSFCDELMLYEALTGGETWCVSLIATVKNHVMDLGSVIDF